MGGSRPPLPLCDFEEGSEADGQSFPSLFHAELEFNSHATTTSLPGFASIGVPNSPIARTDTRCCFVRKWL
ncbi:hypothetical protein SAMN05444141_108174 [Pseudovibrio denitrificans]|uniref:Uncharacterized protein n=1 Tax=Pseudovibrio denitrificans TaxID=258256 RepID=A0A1I7DD25_9HYPH|nr:hypothetical protein SAMN05444141_108174 [Pseudovibrio denitrificans]